MISLPKAIRLSLCLVIMLNYSQIHAQETPGMLKNTVFENAQIRWNNNNPQDIKFTEKTSLAVQDFFREYKRSFELSNDYSFRLMIQEQDKAGFDHQRYQQYYKGIEVAETHYILHARNGRVEHANGNSIHGLSIDTDPTLSVEQAAFFVAKQFPGYKIPSLIDKKSRTTQSLPEMAAPKLVISSGNAARTAENFRLAWRFDVLTTQPLARYEVDIDAKTGVLIGKLPAFYEDNIHTKGISLYNDTVDIVIADTTLLMASDVPRWILNDWNAYGGSGNSWRIADMLLGDNGGYADAWYQALVTDAVELQGTNPALSFYHRYSTELPQDYDLFDAWDGMNVQISSDGGSTWTVLPNPTPAYDKTSLFGFDYHGQGVSVPGWCGLQSEWTQVIVPLSSYNGSTVQVRFVFASDGALSTDALYPDLFGWQIDNILIESGNGILFQNDGVADKVSAVNMNTFQVTFIEGNYRLRETTRGNGIGTYNGETIIDGYDEATDFVENDTLFSEEQNEVGVSVHWALEETYDFYLDHFGRNSYDNLGGNLTAYTNMVFDGDPNNAMYIGGGYMVFGAGDGTTYGPIASIDVVAHELSHGVTRQTANLVYANQSGGLNESYSDIFGKSVEFEAEGIRENWLIAGDLRLAGTAFRSMNFPNAYGQPDTYMGTNWIATDGSMIDYDNGGVHINSGVQNHWFYLLCEGGSRSNDDGFAYNVSPIDIDDALQIAYRTLTSYLVPTSEYIDAALYSIQSAQELFGAGSQQVTSVRDAWEAVGIYMTPRIVVPASFRITSNWQGGEGTEYLPINNKSVATLEITNMTLSGEGFEFTPAPVYPISIDKVQYLGIRFTPDGSAGTGTLTITSNDSELPTVTVNLIGSIGTDLESKNGLTASGFEAAYPNPFRESTQLTFNLAGTSKIQLYVVNTLGEVVRKLADGELAGGYHSYSWDGTNNQHARVATGTYFVILRVDGRAFNQAITIF